MSDIFPMHGLKQGDALSPLLFNSVLEYAIKIQKTRRVPPYTLNYTHAHRVRLCCHNTDYVHVNRHDRTIFIILAKYCTRLPHDVSSVIRNMSEQF